MGRISESEAPFREVAAEIQRRVVNKSTRSKHPFRVLKNKGERERCRRRTLHLGSKRHFKVKTRMSPGGGGNRNNQTLSPLDSFLPASHNPFLLYTFFPVVTYSWNARDMFSLLVVSLQINTVLFVYGVNCFPISVSLFTIPRDGSLFSVVVWCL